MLTQKTPQDTPKSALWIQIVELNILIQDTPKKYFNSIITIIEHIFNKNLLISGKIDSAKSINSRVIRFSCEVKNYKLYSSPATLCEEISSRVIKFSCEVRNYHLYSSPTTTLCEEVLFTCKALWKRILLAYEWCGHVSKLSNVSLMMYHTTTLLA